MNQKSVIFYFVKCFGFQDTVFLSRNRDTRQEHDELLKRSCFTGQFQSFNLRREVKQSLREEGESGKPGLKWKCGRGATRSSEPFYTRTSPLHLPHHPLHFSVLSAQICWWNSAEDSPCPCYIFSSVHQHHIREVGRRSERLDMSFICL